LKRKFLDKIEEVPNELKCGKSSLKNICLDDFSLAKLKKVVIDKIEEIQN
jgi:hypothetical protein